jgi:PIN domain nuclease of toxin-antitoxin system
LVALLFNEPGANRVADVVAGGATVSTVNLAEVATVLVRNNRDVKLLDSLRSQVTVQPFTNDDAIATADLYPRVASRGLSLGDRACLVLADRLTAPAITAERIWTELNVETQIRFIRPITNDNAPGEEDASGVAEED